MALAADKCDKKNDALELLGRQACRAEDQVKCKLDKLHRELEQTGDWKRRSQLREHIATLEAIIAEEDDEYEADIQEANTPPNSRGQNVRFSDESGGGKPRSPTGESFALQGLREKPWPACADSLENLTSPERRDQADKSVEREIASLQEKLSEEEACSITGVASARAEELQMYIRVLQSSLVAEPRLALTGGEERLALPAPSPQRETARAAAHRQSEGRASPPSRGSSRAGGSTSPKPSSPSKDPQPRAKPSPPPPAPVERQRPANGAAASKSPPAEKKTEEMTGPRERKLADVFAKLGGTSGGTLPIAVVEALGDSCSMSSKAGWNAAAHAKLCATLKKIGRGDTVKEDKFIKEFSAALPPKPMDFNDTIGDFLDGAAKASKKGKSVSPSKGGASPPGKPSLPKKGDSNSRGASASPSKSDKGSSKASSKAEPADSSYMEAQLAKMS